MATFYYFKCKKCGWSIESSKKEKDYTMLGGMAFFKCEDCEDVFKSFFDYEHEDDIDKKCPNCNGENTSSWKPANGCPKCGGKLVKNRDYYYFVD